MEFNNIEITILGDLAFGCCVNRPDDISSELRKLSNKPVINLAYPGTGPLIQYATLREYLPIKVNLFWFTEGNDNENLNNELKNNQLLKYLNINHKQDLINKQFLLDKITKNKLDAKIKIIKKNNEFNNFQFIKFLNYII